MANYTSKYTGEQIDEAVGKALANSGGGGTPILYYYRINTTGGQYIECISTDNSIDSPSSLFGKFICSLFYREGNGNSYPMCISGSSSSPTYKYFNGTEWVTIDMYKHAGTSAYKIYGDIK